VKEFIRHDGYNEEMKEIPFKTWRGIDTRLTLVKPTVSESLRAH
jgi:hypothetical protein